MLNDVERLRFDYSNKYYKVFVWKSFLFINTIICVIAGRTKINKLRAGYKIKRALKTPFLFMNGGY